MTMLRDLINCMLPTLVSTEVKKHAHETMKADCGQ